MTINSATALTHDSKLEALGQTKQIIGTQNNGDPLGSITAPTAPVSTLSDTVEVSDGAATIDFIKSLNAKYHDAGSKIPMPEMGLLIPDSKKWDEIVKNTNPFVFEMQSLSNGLNYAVDKVQYFGGELKKLKASNNDAYPELTEIGKKAASDGLDKTKEGIQQALDIFDQWAEQYDVKADAEKFFTEYSSRVFNRNISIDQLKQIFS
ncbi:MAG: hypothetical protein U1E36_06815 [Rickettsiales bacterium]